MLLQDGVVLCDERRVVLGDERRQDGVVLGVVGAIRISFIKFQYSCIHYRGVYLSKLSQSFCRGYQ